jgi:hypothetical protein
MRFIGVVVATGTLISTAICGAAWSTGLTDFGSSAAPVIHIEDVDRFYKVYDAAGGHPTADQLQRDYLDAGSDGLHQFAKMRKHHWKQNCRNLGQASADLRRRETLYGRFAPRPGAPPRGSQRIEHSLSGSEISTSDDRRRPRQTCGCGGARPLES